MYEDNCDEDEGRGKGGKSEQRLREKEEKKRRNKNAVWQFVFSFLSILTKAISRTLPAP